VRKYSGLDQDAVAAGRELGVEAVLDGSLQRAGERVRVRVRLVRVADGGLLWADKFDMKFPDIFAVQDSISERVARSLAVRLSGEERRQMAKRYTENMEAYHLYLKGRYFWNKRTGDGIKKGIEYFHQAIALDLNYALAYSGLADSYALGILSSDVNPEESFPRAKEAAERALSLDDTLAEAHTSLARVKEMFEWDFTGAESEYRRALDLNPNYASAHHRLGLFLSMMGRFDEGLEQLEQARQLDPMSLTINADIGLAHYFARRYDQSVDQLLKTIEMDQSFPPARYYLAEVYVQKRMFDKAIAEARKASELTGGGSWTVLSYSYAAAGRKEEAREVLKDLTAGRWSFQPIALAATYAELGDTDEAFARLEKSYEQRAFLMHRLRVDPKVDDLRPDPRFQDLMRRIGLPQ
jgi:tetratricopeptide (TPR) repeat protein